MRAGRASARNSSLHLPFSLAYPDLMLQLSVLLLLAGGLQPSAETNQPPADRVSALIANGSTLRDRDRRVGEIAWRLATSADSICPRLTPATGILFHHLAEYIPEDREHVSRSYGLDHGPGILAVMGGSPAAAAGLLAGDILLSVNDRPFSTGAAVAAVKEQKERRKLALASEIQLDEALVQGPARLLVLRQGGIVTVELTAIKACPTKIRLANASRVNAFANGKQVTVTTGLLDFVESDDELAVAIAHELAHNALAHPARLDEEGVPKKGLLRAVGGNAKKIWKTEEEADRFAIQMLARAGYDLSAVIPFWERYYGKYDVFPQIFRTHPSLPARIRIAQEEIERVSGEP